MTTGMLFSLSAALIIGIGVIGFIKPANFVRRMLAFNVIGSGIFLLFGALSRHAPPYGPDPVPQALVITGIVVAFASTALALALAIRLFELTDVTGEGSADDVNPE